MEGKEMPGATLCLLSVKRTPVAATATGERRCQALKVSVSRNSTNTRGLFRDIVLPVRLDC